MEEISHRERDDKNDRSNDKKLADDDFEPNGDMNARH